MLYITFIHAVFSTLGLYPEELDPEISTLSGLSEQKYNGCIRSLNFQRSNTDINSYTTSDRRTPQKIPPWLKLNWELPKMSSVTMSPFTKAACSTNQATIIHNMCFTPKDAWESVKILAGGMTIHHEKPTVMWLKLINGELATTDTENASVMWPHLEKVYINHRPFDWSVLHKIPQQHIML